jgi:hypothetical protein
VTASGVSDLPESVRGYSCTFDAERRTTNAIASNRRNGGNHTVNALATNTTSPGSWETFQLVRIE